jgi:O-antigen ligase
MRYLASKGLNKDSIGISKLNTDDVKNIERGNTNYKYDINSGLAYKWRELVWEYTSFKRNRNPSGHTLTMRLEFWKTATYIIKQNLLVGVGTGDVQDAFNQAYVETNSLLDMKWRLRSHNQYLAIGVAFGLIGLVVFIVYLMLPAFLLRDKLQYLYWPFLIIAMLSFITEDTLETQSGVSFFIFFQALFLWLASFQTKTQALK